MPPAPIESMQPKWDEPSSTRHVEHIEHTLLSKARDVVERNILSENDELIIASFLSDNYNTRRNFSKNQEIFFLIGTRPMSPVMAGSVARLRDSQERCCKWLDERWPTVKATATYLDAIALCPNESGRTQLHLDFKEMLQRTLEREAAHYDKEMSRRTLDREAAHHDYEASDDDSEGAAHDDEGVGGDDDREGEI